MAVEFKSAKATKSKSKVGTGTKTKKEQAAERLAELADELGAEEAAIVEIQNEHSEVFDQITGHNTRISEIKEEAAVLADIYLAAEEKGSVKGKHFKLDMSCRRASNSVPDVEAKKGIAKAIGDEAFWEILTLPITSLRKYLGEVMLGKFLSTEYSGSRTMKAKKIG